MGRIERRRGLPFRAAGLAAVVLGLLTSPRILIQFMRLRFRTGRCFCRRPVVFITPPFRRSPFSGGVCPLLVPPALWIVLMPVVAPPPRIPSTPPPRCSIAVGPLV